MRGEQNMKCELKMGINDVQKYFGSLDWKNVVFIFITTAIFTLINIYISIYISIFGVVLMLIFRYMEYHASCK